jgi:RNA polymerase sigma-70 factor (ECF subfamily)
VSNSTLNAFLEARPRLFGIAYRMTGSFAEAEDLLQDTWLRWQQSSSEDVLDPVAFLATITTRLSINHLQSARNRRESYVGPWLPEPVDTSNNPLLGAERSEALELALLLLLEALTPSERAAYILFEAFNYSHRQIAEVLETSEANARQLTSRARKQIASGRRNRASKEQHNELLQSFLQAAQSGDLSALQSLLAPSARSTSDGGGKVTATRSPVVGRDAVAQFIHAIAARLWQGIRFSTVEVNGYPALLLLRDGQPFAITAISATSEGIDEIYWILNPEKLSQFANSSGLG